MSGSSPPRSLYDLSFDELAVALDDDRAGRVFNDLYRRRLRKSPAIDAACRELDVSVAALKRVNVDRGRMTSKYLFGLDDGSAVETVRIRRRDGFTACLSSQVGCGFGCQFCASGKAGLKRHLSPGEIVQQVMELEPGLNRLVYMGIGEPLHNYDAVLKATRILVDRRGRNFKSGGVTISTVGIPKALRRLREEHLKLNLTISLHATTQAVRDELLPGTRSHPIEEVVELSQSWAYRHNRPVTYTYLLLPGYNDDRRDADRLVHWFADAPARVNLMRWNAVDGSSFVRADDATLTGFKRRLERGGVPTVVRDTQGHDIDAACGQLWLRSTTGSPQALAAPRVRTRT